MVICLLYFDASRCYWKADPKKPKEEIVKNYCQNVKCPHCSITERKSGTLLTCDYTWNPFDNRETTPEERQDMDMCFP